jgi:hypothetical protein
MYNDDESYSDKNVNLEKDFPTLLILNVSEVLLYPVRRDPGGELFS